MAESKPDDGNGSSGEDKRKNSVESSFFTTHIFPAQQIFSHNLKTASLEELIVKLVLDRDGLSSFIYFCYIFNGLILFIDREFIKDFLCSYHTYCSPQKLMEGLIELLVFLFYFILFFFFFFFILLLYLSK